MVVLHVCCEYNKSQHAKRGCSRWNEHFYNSYYAYGVTPDFIARICMWWDEAMLSLNIHVENVILTAYR